jgi:hypothetical protein
VAIDELTTVDVQRDLEGDTRELMRVHDLYNMRGLYQRAIEKRRAKGEPDPDDDPLARQLAEWPEVSDLDMLRASRRLVDLLTGRRWYVIQGAREAGASWTEIGDALGISKQAAQQFYQRKIEAQEKYAGDFHDAARARAALEDDRP